MTPTETAALLRRYNEWRRGNLEGQPMPDPREIGEAIDAAIEMIERLEAAEKAAAEAYQRGYATGQEEIEKERDQFKADWLECLALAEEAKPIIDRQRSEIEALRADKEALEREAVRLVEQADDVASDLVSAWKERDALLAALQRIADGQEMSGVFTFADVVLRYQEIARAAIARATGEQP